MADLVHTARNPSENVLQYYRRLKDLVADNLIDLERSEIYGLLFGESVSADHARKAMRTLDLALDADLNFTQSVPQDAATEQAYELPNKSTVEINKDGSQSSSKLVHMSEADTKDGEFLLKAHGYDAEFWELVSARSNIWNAYSKKDGIMELYACKITVKPLKNGLSLEDIQQHFEEFALNYTPNPITPRQYEHGAELLVPCLFDLHVGKLATQEETNGTYNLEIARTRILNSVQSYIDRLHGRKFEKIFFVIGNDYFNCEPSGSTVAGTPQSNCSRYSTMFKKGVEILIEAIDMLSSVSYCEVIFIPGNHATHTEYVASVALAAWYRNSETVTVDCSPTTRKYRRFGKNLIGFTHGDSEKDRLYSLMQCEMPEDWAASVNGSREILTGHLHHEKVIEKNGVTVRHIPSLCNNDYWHSKQGYVTSKKRSMAFIYDKENGLTETHYVNI